MTMRNTDNQEIHGGVIASPFEFILEFFRCNLGILGALAAMVLIVSLMSENFFTASNL